MSVKDGFFFRKPTTIEVIDAIFDQVFTPEEIDQLRGPESGIKIHGHRPIKEDILRLAHVLIPKYSIKKSVRLTNEFVEKYRDDLSDARYYINTFLANEIFKDIKSK